MSPERCMVAVDVGNSAVKLALRREQTVLDHAIRLDATGWEKSAIHWVRDQLGCSDWHWRIASVRGSAANQLTAAIREFESDATIQLVTRHDVPMSADVDHPDRVGIDRLLSAYAALHRVGRPVVVVDAGSAVTVDWVDDQGRFCGGSILPGLRLQSAVLATGTEALPQIDWNSESTIQLPAKNTTDAIRGGILTGISASIDALINRYQTIAGLDDGHVHVVLTGGDSLAISPHLQHTHQRMQNLVCRGLLDLPRSMVGQTNTRTELG